MRRFFALLFMLLLLAGLTACAETVEESPVEAQLFAMDTIMQLSAYGENAQEALEASQQEIQRLEALLSRTQADSPVSQLNRVPGGTPVEVGQEICQLIDTAKAYTDATDGAFDITIAPVASAWGFTEEAYRVPSSQELAALLDCVGMEHVHLSASTAGGQMDTAALDPGTQVDFGGIAKGYAAQQVADIFREQGVASGMISLGGNVWVCGTKPDGSPWRVGIQDPARPEEADAFVGILQLEDAYAVTSGGYQRYFEENGKRYHHIFDPATGYPAQAGLTSVTVVSGEDGTMCDALSTALFVKGEDWAVDFWRGRQDAFDLILVTEDGCVLVTAGIAEAFTADEKAGYTYEIIS